MVSSQGQNILKGQDTALALGQGLLRVVLVNTSNLQEILNHFSDLTSDSLKKNDVHKTRGSDLPKKPSKGKTSGLPPFARPERPCSDPKTLEVSSSPCLEVSFTLTMVRSPQDC